MMLSVKAHGKINLTLDVLGKLPDGYHEVEMVMQEIALHDLVTISPRDDREIVISSNMPEIPLDARNLAYQAAALVLEEFKVEQGLNIHLDKRLPVEAGLAGGSSNGAAVIKGINQLFGLNCSQGKLVILAARLGADAPFFIFGGTALATGIGTTITPLVNNLVLSLILVKPPFGANTGEIYQRLRLEQLTGRPNTKDMIIGLAGGKEHEVIGAMGNVLEEVTADIYPEIREIKSRLREFGLNSLMSGSGTTVFGIIPAGAAGLGEKIGHFFRQKKGYQVFLTTTI